MRNLKNKQMDNVTKEIEYREQMGGCKKGGSGRRGNW